MQFNQDAWGIVALQSRRVEPWSEAEIAWCKLLCTYCETLIRANQTYQEAQRKLVREGVEARARLKDGIIGLLERELPSHSAQIVDDSGLTGREREVLMLIALGRSNRQISEQLVISENTVKKHVYSLFRKIGVESRAQAAGFARSVQLDTSEFFRV